MSQTPKLYERIEIVFGDLWQRPRPPGVNRGFRPNLDSYHTADPHELTVIVEVPGVDPDSLTIAVGERVLVVAGERRRVKAEGRVYQQMEIEYGPFERHVNLGEDVDPGAARARYEQGLLTISLPVAGARTPRARRAIAVERE